MSIPARIIQTGKSRSLSPLAKAAVSNLKLLHPDWEYVYFDDSDIRRFIATEFPQYQEVFDGFPRTIQRIDFFRYLAVFRFGGFYFDLDVFLSESLAPLLDFSCVFSFEELTLNRYLRQRFGMDWEIGNYAFGSAPGHPYLSAVIENCVRAQRDTSWVEPMMAGIPQFCRAEFEVLYSTGPGLLSRTLAENPDSASDLTVLFPEDVRDEENWHQFGHYGVHLMDATWRTRGSYLRRRLMLTWESWSRKRLMPESRQSGPTRNLAAFRAPEVPLVSIP
jgi:inositol phosphorylceramide mannosyltransferase catalytic subunit